MIEDVEAALGANPAEGLGILVVCLLAGLALDLLLHLIQRWAGHRGWRFLGVLVHALRGVPTTLGVTLGAIAVIWLAGLPQEYVIPLARAAFLVLFVALAVAAVRLLTGLVRMTLARDHATISLVNLLIHVYVTDVSGVEPPRQLTADPALDAYPAWSPSGEQLAFRSDRRGNLDIYLLDVATSQSRLFTPSEANDDQPAWSPDGTRIAFVSDRGAVASGGSYDIYVKSVQGSGVVRVTTTAEREQFPRWRPR